VKRAIIALAVIGIVAAGAAPAPAATKVDRKIAALQRQVASLTKQVKTLRTQLTVTRKCSEPTSKLPDVCGLGILGIEVGLCDTAITADALQNSWETINQHESASIFPSRQNVDDSGLCSNVFRVSRQQTLVPPTIAPFQALLNSLLSGRVAPVPRFLLVPPPLSWTGA
jgi:hypothetical protein